MKIGRPLPVGSKAPEGGQDAVDRGVLPVAFHQGELPRDIVDEGDPERAEASGERHQGEDLGDYLQDVDECLPGGEGGEVLLLDDAVVVEDVAVQEQDIAPTILPPGRPRHGVSCRQVPGLLPEISIQEERVGVEHREGPSHPPRPRDQAWAVRCHQTSQRPQGGPKAHGEGVLRVSRRVRCPGVKRLDGRPPRRPESGLREKGEATSQT